MPADLLVGLLTAPVQAPSQTFRTLWLAGAHITGVLNLEAAVLTRPVHFEDCFFDNAVTLKDVRAIYVELPGCHLPGLHAENFESRGDLELNCGFTVLEGVSLLGAHIGGQLSCTGGIFNTVSGDAFIGEGLKVDGGMFCRKGFQASGGFSLRCARIGVQLDCDGGKFSVASGAAFDGDGLRVEGDMFCRNGCVISGGMSLQSAHVQGTLDLTGAEFPVFDEAYLNLERAEVAEAVKARPADPLKRLNLDFARVGAWLDDAGTWPPAEGLSLNGFSYSHIDAFPAIKAKERIGWMPTARRFIPQPYEQLARVYRAEGRERETRSVQVAAQWRRRAAVKGSTRAFNVLWSAILRVTIGYGYHPWRILAPISLLFFSGWFLFSRECIAGVIFRKEGINPDIVFHSARYTLDLLVPGASLGERVNFIATGPAAWFAAAFTLTGWALAAMLIAGLAGVFKRQ